VDDPGERAGGIEAMKSLRLRLEGARKRLELPWEVLERDYLLSWILAGMTQVEVLRDSLVFKGGTALRKCYFGDYRFSEDLDFTGVKAVPTGRAMEAAVKEACSRAVQLLDPYAPVEILCERHTERDPHPGSQEAFDIRARFPWHRQPHVRVMVEVALDEKLLRPPSRRPVLHDYGEPLNAEVATYSLEEIVAEKLRAILQQARALESRSWVRSRARDYYDLWRILGTSPVRLDVSDFEELLREKCAIREVAFSGPDSFFPEAMLVHVEKTWAQWLGPLVPDLPSYERVIVDLHPLIERLFSNKE
jgi:predicted nucleotidyltransferase component of viral defense system